MDFSRQVFAMQKDDNTGGLMSDFSTTSPFWELSYGPQISAPGGNILSTWPVSQGTYAFLSGTSMATPFIAGSIAMYQSIKGKSDSSTTIRGILADTAKPIAVAGPTQGTRGPLDSIAKQGGGLVDVYKAVFHTSRVSPNLIALNDTRFFAGKKTVTISNVGMKTQKYTLSHAPAGTLSTIDTSTNLWNAYPVPISNAPAKVTFSTKSVTISPGQSKSFTVTFSAPSGLDPNTVPVYSGYIKLDSDSSPMRGSLSIPYLGVADDTYNQKILDTTDYVAGVPLPALVDASGNVVTDDQQTFTLAGSDVPSLAFRLRWGTAIEAIDLVFANTTFKPTVPINDPSGSANRRRDGLEKVVRRHNEIHSPLHDHHARAASLQYADVKTVGNVGIGQWVPRDTVASVPSIPMTSTVYVNNGTTAQTVQDGQYKLLLRVKKQFHTYGPESSYESYLSHTFTVQGSQQVQLQ
jgi:Fn3-like domain/Subtilase family